MFGTDNSKTTAKDFFLYLAMAVTLYVSAVALVALWFSYISYLFPDAVRGYYDFAGNSARGWMATLIVAFPLFLVFTRMVNQSIRKHSEKAGLWVRKWLLYLTLFVSGATLAIDVIVLINSFLGGELTTQFLWKILVVLIVAGAVFYYFLSDIRGKWEKRERESLIYGGVSALVVLVSIILGFVFFGSPQTQRDLRFDSERANDLQHISWQIIDYWQNKEEMPQDLSDLEDELRGYIVPTDPETGEPYEYNYIGDLTFELCADFALPSRENRRFEEGFAKPMMVEYGRMAETNWEHGEGRECFERTIDPEFYPPRSVEPRGITG